MQQKQQHRVTHKKMYTKKVIISPLFNQLGQLRISSHLQLQTVQDKAEQCYKNNNTELHMG